MVNAKQACEGIHSRMAVQAPHEHPTSSRDATPSYCTRHAMDVYVAAAHDGRSTLASACPARFACCPPPSGVSRQI
eukprot:364928-Chlamydomonas_euryale.AAC.5